jgi:hypothetical protein
LILHGSKEDLCYFLFFLLRVLFPPPFELVELPDLFELVFDLPDLFELVFELPDLFELVELPDLFELDMTFPVRTFTVCTDPSLKGLSTHTLLGGGW